VTITNRVSLKSVESGITPIDDVVDAPTIGSVTDLATGTSVSVAFTPAATGGPATSFTAVSTPSSITGTASSSPITVTGLTTNTAYTFKVHGTNASGVWSNVQSAASNSVTPTLALSFTERTLPNTALWFGMRSNNGTIATTTQANTNTNYSTNGGATWTSSTRPSSQGVGPLAMGISPSFIFFLNDANFGQSGTVWRSTNGTSWSSVNINYTPQSSCSAFFVPWQNSGNGYYYVRVTSREAAERSSDLINWEQLSIGSQTVQQFNFAHNGSNLGIAPQYGVNTATNTVANGNWNPLGTNLGVTANWASVVWGNNVWAMLGDEGRLITSTNGTSWTDRGTLSGWSANYSSHTSAYGGGNYIFAGNGKYGISKDGVSWVINNMPSSGSYNVIWDNTNSRFVFLRQGSTVVYTAPAI
jgi:hypothetical protein